MSWLNETLKDARRQVLRKFTPMLYIQATGNTVTLPIQKEEADQLYKDLDSHFYAWTGQSLASHHRNNS